ncbi:cell adhesion molecule CEACAM5-like [Clarias gariepinus]
MKNTKPELTSGLIGAALSGNPVTLTCRLDLQSDGWKIYWTTPTQRTGTGTETQYSSSSYYSYYTISSVSVSDGGQYKCRAGRGTPVYYTLYSDDLPLSVTEIKPVVIINPDTQVYRGERVTFRCNIQTGGDTEWTYSWYKNENTQTPHRTTQEFTVDITGQGWRSYGGKYTCRGTRRSDSQISEMSDAVPFSVSEKPKPDLTSDPNGETPTGNPVTLTCTLKPQSVGWKFYWITPTQSNETETKTHSYTITPVSVSDEGQYRCRAGRGDPVYYTHYSDALWVNVTESPKPVVIIKPDTQVFRGERVTFRCDMKRGGDTEWTYEWYRDGYTFSPYSTAQEFTVTDNYYSSGKYTCRGRRRDSQLSQISDPVTLSVSEKPKAVITSSPKGDVLTGNSVTLTCTLNVQSAGWKFYWITPTQSTETETAAQYNSYYYYYYYSLYTIRSVSVSDRGQYKCRAGRGNPVYYTQYSDALWVNVIEIKPVVIINPDTQVFSGERVTFRCNIQTGGDTEWTYSWYRDGHTFYPYSTAQEFTGYYYSSGKYTCRGRRRDSQLSQISDPVTLSISEKPKPELTSSPEGDVLTGNSVTLTCRLNVQSAGWKFYWITLTQSTETETVAQYYYSYYPYYSYSHNTIRSVSVSDGGQYRCRAGRGNTVYYTHYSDELWVNVIESPKPVVIINPDTQVFRGETVTFRCNIQTGGDTEWTYSWYKNNNTQLRDTTQELIISSVRDSDGGKYTCGGRRRDSQLSQISHPVTLSVSEKPKPELNSDLKGAALMVNPVILSCTLKPQSAGWKFYWIKDTESNETETGTFHYFIRSVSVSDGDGDVILESPVHPVTEGNPLTLRCLYRNTNISDSGADFYKDGSVLQKQTTGEMTISSVSKSDEGFYHCTHPKRGESPKSWVSVRGFPPAPLSVLKILSSVVAASPYVLVTIILAVKCYRARTELTEDNTPYRVIEAEASL